LPGQQSVRASPQSFAGFAKNVFRGMGRHFVLVEGIHAIFNLFGLGGFNVCDRWLE
jgi:hypothetical protein